MYYENSTIQNNDALRVVGCGPKCSYVSNHHRFNNGLDVRTSCCDPLRVFGILPMQTLKEYGVINTSGSFVVHNPVDAGGRVGLPQSVIRELERRDVHTIIFLLQEGSVLKPYPIALSFIGKGTRISYSYEYAYVVPRAWLTQRFLK